MLLYYGTSLDFHIIIRQMSSNTMYEWPSYNREKKSKVGELIFTFVISKKTEIIFGRYRIQCFFKQNEIFF